MASNIFPPHLNPHRSPVLIRGFLIRFHFIFVSYYGRREALLCIFFPEYDFFQKIFSSDFFLYGEFRMSAKANEWRAAAGAEALKSISKKN